MRQKTFGGQAPTDPMGQLMSVNVTETFGAIEFASETGNLLLFIIIYQLNKKRNFVHYYHRYGT